LTWFLPHLERNPKIDPAAAQWQAQRAMMMQLATGGRPGMAIGVAGSGKSTALAPLVDAWKEEGRQVFGITLSWRQAGDLEAAGIEKCAAIAAFLKRVKSGRYTLDRNSVVVVDEIGLVGITFFLQTPAADPAIRVKDKSVSESFGNE
jgi:ATP-dependent exoDNAse (exonuclease V) alpha subunit